MRIALDLVLLTMNREFEIGIIFSQDQDLAEATREVIAVARKQDRWIELYSAFPCSAQTTNVTPIGNTMPIRIERAVYDACLDPNDYTGRRHRR